MKKLLFLLALPYLLAAQNPAPNIINTKPLYIFNATLNIGDGTVIENGAILIENQKIKDIGTLSQPTINNLQVIDAKGKSIYPGIITPNSNLGIVGIEALRMTKDNGEMGDFNPELRTLTSYNTDSEIIPTVRSSGILITQATPSRGLISGRSSIMNLDGWNWEDAVLKEDDGLWINWPNRFDSKYNRKLKKVERKENLSYNDDINSITLFFKNAKTYFSTNSTGNSSYESIKGIINNNNRLYIKTSSSQGIKEAIQLFTQIGIKNIVIVSDGSVIDAIPTLKKHNISILIDGTHRLPKYADDDIWEPYKLPKILLDQGILTGMYYNESGWRTKNIIFAAGTAAAYGLDKNKALSLITLNNAKILGIEDKVGSLEKGKQATFFIAEGDVLNMSTSKVINAYINGTEINLDNKHKRLNQKYIEKYQIAD